MSWFPILALAAFAFLVGVFVLRVPKSGYALLGATLLFGLAGYALQGSPGQPSAPSFAQVDDERAVGGLLVHARRELHDPAILPSRFLITSDAFARRGDYQRAAAFARNAVVENPNDTEAWTALGIALTEHAGGQLTPAALYAFGQAEQRAPESPAPDYFMGLAMLRAGDPVEARELWASRLAKAPADAVWRPLMADRLARLDALIAQMR